MRPLMHSLTLVGLCSVDHSAAACCYVGKLEVCRILLGAVQTRTNQSNVRFTVSPLRGQHGTDLTVATTHCLPAAVLTGRVHTADRAALKGQADVVRDLIKLDAA